MTRSLPVLALAFGLVGCVPPATKTVRRIDAKVDVILDNQEQILANQDEMMAELDELVEASRRQGTGEITLFFNWHDTKLNRGSPQHERLVAWLDHLVLESRGREIVFTTVGSATDWKRADWNHELSRYRAWTAKDVISRHLVHVPHRWGRSYGVGDQAAPPDARGRTWRHVRIIAVYDEGQLPTLPPEP